jgi:hypothetical protein
MQTRLLDDFDQDMSPEEELKVVTNKLSHLAKHIEKHKESMARVKAKLTDINLEKLFLADQHVKFLLEIYSLLGGMYWINPDETDPFKFILDLSKVNRVLINIIGLKRRAEISLENMGVNKFDNPQYPAMQMQYDVASNVLQIISQIIRKERDFDDVFKLVVDDYFKVFAHLEDLTDQLVYLQNEKKGLEEKICQLKTTLQEKVNSIGDYVAPRRRF